MHVVVVPHVDLKLINVVAAGQPGIHFMASPSSQSFHIQLDFLLLDKSVKSNPEILSNSESLLEIFIVSLPPL